MGEENERLGEDFVSCFLGLGFGFTFTVSTVLPLSSLFVADSCVDKLNRDGAVFTVDTFANKVLGDLGSGTGFTCALSSVIRC